MADRAAVRVARPPRPSTLSPARFDDASLVDEDFAPAPDPSDAAPEAPALAEGAKSLPRAVRTRARAAVAPRAPTEGVTAAEVRKARDESRAALEASRYRGTAPRKRGSPFAGASRGEVFDEGAGDGKGRVMARPKKRARIGVVRLCVIIGACAVGGTYAGLYLQQLFNDALPKSSVYEVTKKTPPPSSAFTF